MVIVLIIVFYFFCQNVPVNAIANKIRDLHILKNNKYFCSCKGNEGKNDVSAD